MLIGNLREVDVVKAFALFAVASVVGGALVGALAGMFLGFFVALTGGSLATVQLGGAILGGVLGLVVSYYFFRTVTLKIIAPKLVG